MSDSINFSNGRKYIVIIGCLILSFVMGSIHAFSVFLEPIETEFTRQKKISYLINPITFLKWLIYSTSDIL